jgi:hypothetical protein
MPQPSESVLEHLVGRAGVKNTSPPTSNPLRTICSLATSTNLLVCFYTHDCANCCSYQASD